MKFRTGKSLTIPKEIIIPLPKPGMSINLIISFYNQDKRKFKVVSISETRKKLWREVRIEDVLYRYLPGSIRPITKVFLVMNVNPDKKEIYVAEVDKQNILNIWKDYVNDIEYCLNLSLIKGGRIFTTSDIKIEFASYSQPGDFLDWIIVYRTPLGTKLIRKDYEDRKIRLSDGRVISVKIPKFRLCGYKTLDDYVKQKLETRIITRGVHISIKAQDIANFLDAILSKLHMYMEYSVEALKKDVEMKNVRELELIKILSYLIITEYLHYALHLILNISSELNDIRIDDLEHYIAVDVESDDKLQEFLREFILGKDYKHKDPFKIEVVVANEVDLIAKIKWHEVYNKISGYKSTLTRSKPPTDILQELVLRLYMPRCFHEPLIVEDIMSQQMTDNNIQIVINELSMILELSEYIVDKIVQRIGQLS